MPYQYFGKPSLYQGKPLFKILSRLKDFGQGRIVYRTIDHFDHPGEVSFYRILLAQPEMDEETLRGRVVAERVYRNRRRKHPEVLSSVVHKPDFRLVPKEEEEEFCKWDTIRDYDPKVDAPKRPKYFEMPPLLREVIARRGAKGTGEVSEEVARNRDYRLPAYKIYEGDVILTDEVRPHSQSQFLNEQHATHRDFRLADIPDEWRNARYSLAVGRRMWEGFEEETKYWDKQEEKQRGWEELLEKKRQRDEAEKA